VRSAGCFSPGPPGFGGGGNRSPPGRAPLSFLWCRGGGLVIVRPEPGPPFALRLPHLGNGGGTENSFLWRCGRGLSRSFCTAQEPAEFALQAVNLLFKVRGSTELLGCQRDHSIHV